MQSSLENFKRNFLSDVPLESVAFSENLSYFQGIGLSPNSSSGICFTENLRLIVFNQLPDSFDIDFVSQDLQAGVIYVIPPDHKYHISLNSNCQFYCFDIPLYILDIKFTKLLNAIAYEEHKVVEPYIRSDFLNWLVHLDSHISTTQIIEILKREIINSNSKKAISYSSDIKEEQYVLGNRFLNLLLKSELQLEHTIQYYAAKLGCCTRTLQRACLINFKVSPQQMIRHHLFIKSLRLLLNKSDSIEDVALKLGYSNHSAFCKFTKAHIDLTPKKIRRLLLSSNAYL